MYTFMSCNFHSISTKLNINCDQITCLQNQVCTLSRPVISTFKMTRSRPPPTQMRLAFTMRCIEQANRIEAPPSPPSRPRAYEHVFSVNAVIESSPSAAFAKLVTHLQTHRFHHGPEKAAQQHIHCPEAITSEEIKRGGYCDKRRRAQKSAYKTWIAELSIGRLHQPCLQVKVCSQGRPGTCARKYPWAAHLLVPTIIHY